MKKKLIKYQVLYDGGECSTWDDDRGKECVWILAESKKEIQSCLRGTYGLEIRTEAEVLKAIEKKRKLVIKEFKLAKFRTPEYMGWVDDV